LAISFNLKELPFNKLFLKKIQFFNPYIDTKEAHFAHTFKMEIYYLKKILWPKDVNSLGKHALQI
jgi:hypothetical protein